MKTLSEAVSPRSRCRAGQGIKGMRGIAFALAAGIAFAAFPAHQASATVFTQDFNVTLDPSQLFETGGIPSGMAWKTILNVSGGMTTITLNPGDEVRGIVTFNNGDGTALKIQDNGSGFLIHSGTPGSEHIFFFPSGLPVPVTSVVLAFLEVEFLNATPLNVINVNPISGTSGATGTSALGFQIFENVVDTGESFTFTAFSYSLTHTSGPSFTFDSIDILLRAASIEILDASPIESMDESVATHIRGIGGDFVACGSTDSEPEAAGECTFQKLPEVIARDCSGIQSACSQFLQDNPQIATRRPDGMKFIYVTGSFCTKIYFTFRGTEYEICKELLP